MRRLATWAAGIAMVLPASVLAAPNNWNGTGNWNTPGNWSLGIPVDGADVVIQSGNVTLTNGTKALASYTLNAGATNTFAGWMSAVSSTVVTVEGTMTHTTNTDTSATGGWVPDARVYVTCSNFTLTADGVVDVDGKGWTSKAEGSDERGYGPGGGAALRYTTYGQNVQGSGGYGGYGYAYNINPIFPLAGLPYGDETCPTNPGSGGKNDNNNGPGGYGGGAVRIDAGGRVTVNGTITAEGGAIAANYLGAGSGGGIYITASTFAGTNGLLKAKGGDVNGGTTGGCGAGGRIAVVFTNMAAQNMLPRAGVSMSATPGDSVYGGGYASNGTVYVGAHYLDVTAAPGGGTDIPSGWYTNGASVTVTATNATDYEFASWTGSGVPAGSQTSNPLNVTMDQDRTIQPVFVSTAPTARTWHGDNNWLSTTNWTPNGTPGPNDTLKIHIGSCLLADAVSVASLSVSNATLTCSNWTTSVTATNVTVLNGGVITHAGPCYDSAVVSIPGTPNSNRVCIVCTNLLVADGGMIDADKKGYAGGGMVTGINAGYGPGKCSEGARAGNSHGGRGSEWADRTQSTYPKSGTMYGVVEAPVALGTGGPLMAGGGPARPGGGAIRIQARSVVVNGVIRANGGVGNAYAGGSTGGSIWITCNTFRGTNGTVSADGEDNGALGSPGGGGGRIAVVYDPTAQRAVPVPTVVFSVKRGEGGVHGDGSSYAFGEAESGTLHFPDTQFLTETGETQFDGRLHFASAETSWTTNSLTLSGGWARFPTGFTLTVTGDVTVDGTAKLSLPNGVLNIGGNLVVENGGDLSIYAGETNGTMAYGALVDVGGDIIVYSSGTLRPYSEKYNGGSVLFHAANMTIESHAAVNADCAGWYGNAGPGWGDYTAYGGGGYGGRGGRATPGQIDGGTYGLTNTPVHPGSGGGGREGRSGGGLVWVEATGNVTVDGAITACSTGRVWTTYDQWKDVRHGVGSGGGIYLRCARIGGSGVLRADGGDAYYSTASAGGGGRIAVWRTRDTFNHANASAAGGAALSGGTYNGEDGTVYWGDVPPNGTVFIIR